MLNNIAHQKHIRAVVNRLHRARFEGELCFVFSSKKMYLRGILINVIFGKKGTRRSWPFLLLCVCDQVLEGSRKGCEASQSE
jgi:hypothetical protein